MKKKYWEKVKKDRYFCIKDINCTITIEFVTRKYMLRSIDDYVESMKMELYDPDTAYTILYNDGSLDYISEDYDGHKIKRTNIESIVCENPCTVTVYGNFEINEYGVVSPSVIETTENGIIETSSEYF